MISPRREMMARSLFRSVLVVLAVAAGLAGCANSKVGRFVGEQTRSISRLTNTAPEGMPWSPAEIAATPHALAALRTRDRGFEQLVLGRQIRGDHYWLTRHYRALTLRGGRILHTEGFDTDLGAVAFTDPDPLPRALDLPGEGVSYARANKYAPEKGHHRLTCALRPAGNEILFLAGQRVNTARFEESCQAAADDWSFTNRFWLDARTGYIWKSIQTISPQTGAVEITMLKQVRGN